MSSVSIHTLYLVFLFTLQKLQSEGLTEIEDFTVSDICV